ncbi:undecaprenyl/decaprenyl-phosphate alpha-N-acetylglucosaminyl 1-phosphate transferase, partial [Candidatus Sumerlaeota bacterium]|nr:undecaprenyl/decaprenyl-phosphate alpha-N-acetylglucosaminyl 1-phosphate transferase [Candidatus Sumerlaeota bacterium]
MQLIAQIPFNSFTLFLGIGFVGPFIVSLFLTQFSLIIARRFKILAIPNERSSHTRPTPRIGGIGFVVTFFVFLYLSTSFVGGDKESRLFIKAVAVGGGVAFLLGLIDDIIGLSPLAKLAGQIIPACSPLIFALHINRIYVPLVGSIEMGVLGLPLTVLWLLFFINAFNFMDGMDGKAGSFTTIVVASLIVYFFWGHWGELSNSTTIPFFITVCGILMGVIGGFLVFNFPPARTFMGDCGSQFLGYLLGLFAVYFSENFIGFVIVLMPFIYDVVYTLFWRWRQGLNLLQAHRSHLYQRLMRIGYSHKQVLQICIYTYLLCAGCFLSFSFTEKPIIKAFSFVGALLVMVVY